MTEVFAETFFFVALLNPRDQHHQKVHAGFQTNRFHLVTTLWVLVEVANSLCSRRLRSAVHGFIVSTVEDSAVHIAGELEWFHRGLDLFGRRPDKDWSLTDCISFVFMQERGLTHALTADRHFAQAGFVPMLA